MDLDLIRRQVTAEIQVGIAFTALAIWDWLALLPAEYKHIWKAKRVTPARIVYLANRYGSLVLEIASMALIVTDVSPGVCSKWFWVQTLGLIYVVCVSDILLAIRVTALYENDKRIVFGLGLLVTTQVALMTAVGVQLRPVEIPPPIAAYIGLKGCLTGRYIGSHANFAYVLSAAPFFTNLLLLSMICYRSRRISKDLGGTQLPILKRMVRDGLGYFVVITAFNLMNVGFYVQSHQAIKTFGVGPLVVISSTLSCRLVLGLLVDKPVSLSHEHVPTLKYADFVPGTPRSDILQRHPSLPPATYTNPSSLLQAPVRTPYASKGMSSEGPWSTHERNPIVDEEKEVQGR